jgi:uncharacterized protein (TIRG00374 family)
LADHKPKPHSYRWVSIAAVLLAGLLLCLALRDIDWETVLKTFQSAQFGWILLGAAVAVISFLARGLRWWVLLSSAKPVRRAHVFWVMMVGYLGNNLLPGRAGELVRTVVISRSEGLTLGFSLATVISERVLDAVFLILIASISMLSNQNFPGSVSGAVRSLGIVGLIGLAVLLLAYRFRAVLEEWALRLPLPAWLKQKAISGLTHFLSGLGAFQKPAQAVGFLGLTILIWLLDALGCTLVGIAFNLTITIPQALLFLAALGLSSSLPATPGYVGVFQFVAVTVLPLFGFLKSEALVFVLVLQMVNYFTVICLGCFGLWRIGLGVKEVQRVLTRA